LISISISKRLSMGAVWFCFGLANHAMAGSLPVSGSYTYGYTSTTNDASCTAPADGTRDYFESTSGGNSISGSDPVAFSICDGAAGILDDGAFTLGTGPNTATGIFTGVYVGLSDNPGTLPDGGGSLDGGALFDGTFTITSANGNYENVLGDVGTFEVNTGTLSTPGAVNGTFDFTSAPEPVSMLLAGSGLLLVGLSKKLRKR